MPIIRVEMGCRGRNTWRRIGELTAHNEGSAPGLRDSIVRGADLAAVVLNPMLFDSVTISIYSEDVRICGTFSMTKADAPDLLTTSR